jgi:ribosome recycling factor
MKETVRDVVGGFVTGVKSGVSNTPMRAGLEIDLSPTTNAKIDEIILNVSLLQEKTTDELRSILGDVVEQLARDVKSMSADTSEKLAKVADEVTEKIDYRWKITQVLIIAGMVGNALAILIAM